jgi:putative nucleotidyltransferase with HDIG domain
MGLFDSLRKAAAAKPSPSATAVLLEPPKAKSETAAVAGHSSYVSAPSVSSPGNARRVLFVGGDESWLGEIQRDLGCLQSNWKTEHAADCGQAVEKWADGSFDTLILDGKIPDGSKLFKALEKELAQSVCLVRCQTMDRSTSAQWKGTGATLIPEDTDAAALVSNIKRSACVQDWMGNEAIRKLVLQIRKLPAQPKLHTEVTNELKSENGSMDVVGKLISQEPVMSAKIMQVVNSAFFGLTREISDPGECVMVLGAERIKALILLAGVFSQYAGSKCPGFAPEPVWGHSIQVGAFARAIALAETKNARTAEAAFTAGLLHDIGKLILAGNLPEMYDTVQKLKVSKSITTREAEMEILGTSHAELGACLLATWGLPLPILEAIAWHHEPSRSDEKGFTLLAAVHAANVFAQETTTGETARDTVDKGYFLHAGLGDCHNRWREFCGLEPQAPK